jgi:hypothetical protein
MGRPSQNLVFYRLDGTIKGIIISANSNIYISPHAFPAVPALCNTGQAPTYDATAHAVPPRVHVFSIFFSTLEE